MSTTTQGETTESLSPPTKVPVGEGGIGGARRWFTIINLIVMVLLIFLFVVWTWFAPKNIPVTNPSNAIKLLDLDGFLITASAVILGVKSTLFGFVRTDFMKGNAENSNITVYSLRLMLSGVGFLILGSIVYLMNTLSKQSMTGVISNIYGYVLVVLFIYVFLSLAAFLFDIGKNGFHLLHSLTLVSKGEQDNTVQASQR